jgi:hypothetical protein
LSRRMPTGVLDGRCAIYEMLCPWSTEFMPALYYSSGAVIVNRRVALKGQWMNLLLRLYE